MNDGGVSALFGSPAKAGAQAHTSNLDPGFRRATIWLRLFVIIAVGIVAFLLAHPAFAQAAAPSTAPAAAAGGGLDRAMKTIGGTGQPLSLSLQILLLMSLLTVLPSLILMMTSFTRIIIVLSLLRQALGLQQTPPNQVLVGLALFLSMFVMRPAIDQINATAYKPYGAGQIPIEEAVARSGNVLHAFMIRQTRQTDLKMFADMAKAPKFSDPSQVPFTILLPAYVTSELKTAFQIGFLIFLPFLVIDLVIASTLMALGMMMLSPAIISMPFKLLLFVLVDGWALTMGSLAGSFQ
jgi:flagellar biosynthetic protein FliP